MFLTVRMTRFLKYYIDVLHMDYTWKNHLCSTKVIHNVLFCGKYINLPSMSMENVWNTLVTWVLGQVMVLLKVLSLLKSKLSLRDFEIYVLSRVATQFNCHKHR